MWTVEECGNNGVLALTRNRCRWWKGNRNLFGVAKSREILDHAGVKPHTYIIKLYRMPCMDIDIDIA